MDDLAFARALKELTAGEKQIDVARKLGYQQSRVSQLMRGERPSREAVERIIEVYGVDREKWLALAGFKPSPRQETQEELLSRIAGEAARLAADEVERRLARGVSTISDGIGQYDSPRNRFRSVVQARSAYYQEMGYDVPGYGRYHQGTEHWSDEDADGALLDWEYRVKTMNPDKPYDRDSKGGPR